VAVLAALGAQMDEPCALVDIFPREASAFAAAPAGEVCEAAVVPQVFGQALDDRGELIVFEESLADIFLGKLSDVRLFRESIAQEGEL